MSLCNSRYSTLYLAASILNFAFAVGCFAWARSIESNGDGFVNLIFNILGTVLGAIFCGLTVAFCHLATLPVSRLHTASTALVHYFFNLIIYCISYKSWRKTNWQAKNVRESQAKLLAEELARNAKTEYGRKFGFADIKNYEQFKARVPLSTYETYRSYIDRIENGEQNLLSADEVTRLNVSSGTTGKCKLLPCSQRVVTNFLTGFIFPLMYRHAASHPGLSPLAPLKSLDLLFSPKWRYAACGLPIGPLSGTPGKEPFLATVGRTTPAECQEFMAEPAQMYIHWLYTLFDDEICRFNGSFAGSELVAFEFLVSNWKLLTEDIRNGTLTNRFGIPNEVASAVKLPSDPRRADAIQAEFSKGFQGIAKRLWPNLSSNWCICTGAHAVYRDRLRSFLGEDVVILSPLFGSSEAIFGIPMSSKQDETFTYSLLAGVTFMEFIPEDEINAEQPSTLLMHQLEVGKRYEIVPTSSIGFYRYRIGDVVKVVDFYHSTPVVQFCTRVGGILDIRGEKTSEDMVYSALKSAVSRWGNSAKLLDFTASEGESFAKAVPDQRESYMHYVLFVEVEGISRPLSADEVAIFDKALQEISYPYKSFRIKDGIGAPKIFSVKPGTFESLKRMILERNSAVSNQYKTPRYQANADLLRFLFGCSQQQQQ